VLYCAASPQVPLCHHHHHHHHHHYQYQLSRNWSSDHSPSPRIEIKNAWRYTSTPQCILMALCLVKHRDSYTFYFQTRRYDRPIPLSFYIHWMERNSWFSAFLHHELCLHRRENFKSRMWTEHSAIPHSSRVESQVNWGVQLLRLVWEDNHE
jgi:hypothetical protein